MSHEQFAASQPSMDMAMIRGAHATQRSLTLEIKQLRAALQQIVEENPPDTTYSWCQTRLVARCHQIALSALSPEQPSETV